MAQPTWNTPVGTIGTFPFNSAMLFQLSASPVIPATSITYAIITGELPTGVTLASNGNGLISGIPLTITNSIFPFTVRATDNLNNIRDRTFSISITGNEVPQFVTPQGVILSTLDSLWIRFPILYSNPDPTNIITIELQEGLLPPGLELSALGLIQGYPTPPTVEVTLPVVSTVSVITTVSTNLITVLNIIGITTGRPVVFTGTTFGNITAGTTYYIREVDVATSTFTISVTQFGDVFPLSTGTGSMVVTLPSTSVGEPTIRTYPFTLRLRSPLGGASASYSITVINQNTPVSQGGPGNIPNTRVPTILNTRPLTIEVNDTDPYYGYYILPPVPTFVEADIGTIVSDNYFSFKMIGYDFDGSPLEYIYSELPSGLTGDSETGWITGYPSVLVDSITNYNFNVSVRKQDRPFISTTNFNFSFRLSKEIRGNIDWITPSDLGTIFNGDVSILSVVAISDVSLQYRITSGSLPPNLVLLSNGEITGYVADQPTNRVLNVGENTEFTVTIQAFSPDYPIVISSKTFVVNVLQQFGQPTDVLYIKATPSIEDRLMIDSLLNDDSLIPTDSLYRPNDIYFGKATSVIYEHAYGIYASDIQQYLAAVTQNHYWRNITLGELKTAVAKNDAGDIIYEVVYSEVIDNLVNPLGISIQSQIDWPRPIDLGLGPWYTSIPDIYTSYIDILGQQYYTSLTPGFARVLYPNSLYNMRNRVADVLGQEFDSRLLPQWMTSQQANGSTLGYTQAWVICYTKPGLANAIKTTIETTWPFTLNQINFRIDRFSVNKSITYDYNNGTQPPAWTGLPSATPVPDPLDSNDFYVLFPQQTVLPNSTQY